MTENMFVQVDYLQEARDRYTFQFTDKPVFDKYIKIFLDELNVIQEAYKDLMQLRSIDTAAGTQLDQIGNIVGQPRVLTNYDAFPYFGFDGASAALSFGTLADSSVGGIFRSYLREEGSSAVIDDNTYRFIIKARIAANTTRATPEDIIKGLNFITGNTNSCLIEQPLARITIEVQNNLTDFEKYFLTGLSNQGSIIPIPIGVAVDFVFFEEDYFGFSEDANAFGFAGDVGGYGQDYGMSYGYSAVSGGGTFSTLV